MNIFWKLNHKMLCMTARFLNSLISVLNTNNLTNKVVGKSLFLPLSKSVVFKFGLRTHENPFQMVHGVKTIFILQYYFPYLY